MDTQLTPTTHDEAIQFMNHAAIACAIIGVLSGILFAVTDGVFVAIFAGGIYLFLALGIALRSRFGAVLALVMYLVDVGFALADGISGGIIIKILIIGMLIKGVTGAFAYHKERDEEGNGLHFARIGYAVVSSLGVLLVGGLIAIGLALPDEEPAAGGGFELPPATATVDDTAG